MRIYIGADHRGFDLKQKMTEWLKEEGQEVVDCGNDHLDPVDDSSDFAKAVAEKITDNSEARGIRFCGSGIAMSIMANRSRGVRCALGINEAHVKHGVENDHINCLAIPAEFVDLETAKKMIITFLHSTPKNDEKYLRRLKKLDE